MFYPYKLLLLFFLTSNSSFMLRGFENKKISSSKGRLWVERLKSSWDLKDTTAYRKEYKAVLSKKNFTRLISDINQDLTFKKNQLEKKEAQTQIRLEKRDKSKKGFYNKDDMKKIRFAEKITENEIRKENFIYSFLSSVREKMEARKK